MAANTQTTDIVKYSTNEGRTWSILRLSEKVDIINIVTEPDNTCVHFLILALMYDETKGYQGVVISLDFKNVLKNECGDPDTYQKPDSDYELWYPFKNTKCLLGQRKGYVKRKPDARCFNGQEFERMVVNEPCECTEEDWECDVGFFRDKNGPCVREKKINESKLGFKKYILKILGLIFSFFRSELNYFIVKIDFLSR